MDTIQINNISVTTNENVFTSCPDSKIIEQEQFCHSLASQMTTKLPAFCQDSLDQVLMNSLYNWTNPRPLALYIYDDQSPATQIFNTLVLCSESLNAYLAENFVLWAWSLTQKNYYELLTTLATHVGEEIATVIHSSPTELYPLLVCLIFNQGEIKIECIIQGIMSDSEVFGHLIQVRDTFSDQFHLPDTTGLSLTSIQTENWSIPASTLTQVSLESNEFRRVAVDFNEEASSIVRIDRIENTVWLMQYLNQKRIVDARLGHNDTEKLLFHGCQYAAAEQILQQAFDHNRIGRHGASYGQGFYFSTRRDLSDRYAMPNPSTGEKRILMCRVLVGRSCKGDPTMTTCPSNYDSTTGRSGIYVVYSNRHILPEYLITYKKNL